MNSQHSTGPRTPERKAAVAQNRTTHGLTGAFRVLACEDLEDYRTLLDEYTAEYQPATPTERFFVTELAQAQWRIMRAAAIEAEILQPGDNPGYAAIADAFRNDDAIARLNRYAEAARRAYYQAQDKLQAIRRDSIRDRREETRDYERRMVAYIEAPPPTAERPIPIPMPPDLQRELAALRRRDPDFDPVHDASQMSKTLRRWFENRAA
jgi:hypothetical protein